ncbi:hypothetical protein NW754_007397 [Fusarium falciforme]|nr:hypothetical protein NW754_007397 [Fusarium falciforme]
MLRIQGKKKSVIIIAVSSPYDFVLDKTIGTYVCTFDFTENAMQALTSSASLKPLHSVTTETFEVPSSRVEAAHFVVRNSSTKALYGFAATYCVENIGILAAVMVDPAKQHVSIGRSLHRRAVLHLKTKPGIKQSSWEVHSLEDFQECLLMMKSLGNGDLGSWSMPDDILGEIRRANITFDLVQGSSHAESDAVMAMVDQHATPEVSELYQFALNGAKSCGIKPIFDLHPGPDVG